MKKALNFKDRVSALGALKRAATVAAVFLIAAVMAVSCGEKRKSPAVMLASPENVKIYLEGFRTYFNISDNTKDAGKARYLFRINKPALTSESENGCFIISVSDNGGEVHVNLEYTVGAKDENVTIVNPNITKGFMSNKVNFTLSGLASGGDPKIRAKAIASAIYEKLTKIEGKK